MSRHATGNWMNTVFDGDAALLKNVSQLTHRVLRLCGCESIARHEDDFVCIRELSGNIVETDFAHRSLEFTTAYCRRSGTSECTKQHVRHRTIHCPAHKDGENETREAVECAGDNEHFVIQYETSCRRSQARVRVEQ